MAHTKVRFVKTEDSGGDSQAHVFNECFKRLYGLEHLYDREDISPEERCKRRKGLETKEIMITLQPIVNKKSFLKIQLLLGTEQVSKRGCSPKLSTNR